MYLCELQCIYMCAGIHSQKPGMFSHDRSGCTTQQTHRPTKQKRSHDHCLGKSLWAWPREVSLSGRSHDQTLGRSLRAWPGEVGLRGWSHDQTTLTGCLVGFFSWLVGWLVGFIGDWLVGW